MNRSPERMATPHHSQGSPLPSPCPYQVALSSVRQMVSPPPPAGKALCLAADGTWCHLWGARGVSPEPWGQPPRVVAVLYTGHLRVPATFELSPLPLSGAQRPHLSHEGWHIYKISPPLPRAVALEGRRPGHRVDGAARPDVEASAPHSGLPPAFRA